MRFKSWKLLLNGLAIAGLAGGCHDVRHLLVPGAPGPVETTSAAIDGVRAAAPLPPRVTLGKGVCDREGPADGTIPLRLVPAGRPFAWLRGASHARARLDGVSASFEAVAAPYRLAAHVAMADLPLYPAEPVTFGGVVIASGAQRLRAIAAGPALVTAELRLPEAVEPTGARRLEPATVRADVPCEAVSLGASDVDLSLLDEGEERSLVGGDTVLSARPMSAPAVRLRLRDDDRTVTVLEREATSVRVAKWAGDVVLVGWVRPDLLRPAEPRSRRAVRRADVRESPSSDPGEPGGRPLQCAHELALVAEVDGLRRQVGVIDSDGPIFALADEDDGFTSVTPFGKSLVIAEGARLFVRTADLDGCR